MLNQVVSRDECDRQGPLVSIVMPSYRMGPFIRTALGSIREQTYGNWELIVVDDCGPEDGTSQAVADFEKGYDAGKVTFLRHAVNQGVSAARNTAIDRAAGELVAFLDPDDHWASTFLERCVARLAGESDIDIVASPVLVFSGDADPGKGDLHRINSIEVERFPHSLAIGNPIQPSAAMVRTKSLRAIGGFTSAQDLQHVEDWDLWIRLVQSGAKFGFLQEALSYYRRHSESATASDEKTTRLIANLIAHHRAWFDVNQLRYLKVLSCEVELLRQQTARLERPSIRLILKLDQWISSLLKPFSRANR
jgi:glycosyltransferase involved in cell wall biosynthesis